jgi:SprT protein
MQQQIINIVESCFNRILGYVPHYTIVYKTIGRGIAGTAQSGKNILTFDPFFLNQNPAAYMARTVPHEVGHLICSILYPRAKQSHGPEWKSIMSRLEAPTTRCHSYDVTDAPGRHERPYQYGCACEGKTFALTGRMHKSIEQGKNRICRNCKSTVVLKGISK